MRDTRENAIRRLVTTALLLMAGLMLQACQSAESTHADADAARFVHGPANPALVMQPELPVQISDESLAWAGTDWEAGRLDHQLGASGSPYPVEFGIAEIRQHDRLRSNNGRPRDSSWTYSRSIQRRSGP